MSHEGYRHNTKLMFMSIIILMLIHCMFICYSRIQILQTSKKSEPGFGKCHILRFHRGVENYLVLLSSINYINYILYISIKLLSSISYNGLARVLLMMMTMKYFASWARRRECDSVSRGVVQQNHSTVEYLLFFSFYHLFPYNHRVFVCHSIQYNTGDLFSYVLTLTH